MELGFATRMLVEGSANVLVPEIQDESSAHLDHLLSIAPVFYNPRMKLNRDIAVLALQVYQKSVGQELVVCEPMCGTGVRGIRIAREVEGVGKVTMGDLNPQAAKLASLNVEANDLKGRVEVRNLEANLLLALHAAPEKHFSYIDIDPFGSPVYFLDPSIKVLKKGGLLALTATDMAPLCGAHPQACLRKYGGSPLHSDYCKEVALRILVGALASTAARYERAVRVVFSHSTDHYVRAYTILDYGSEKSSQSLSEMGYILHCPRCLNRRIAHKINEVGEGQCGECGGAIVVAGPLWLGLLSEASFCDGMIETAEEKGFKDMRLKRLLQTIHSESGYPPTFFNIDKLSSLLNLTSPPTVEFLRTLRKKGYKASRTHFHPRGVKTDAPSKALIEVLLSMSTTQSGT